MNDTKILSIIVPSYNTYEYIDSCLPYFCNVELEKYINVFLIDDGANLETVNKLKQYEKKYPNIFKYIHKENGGHGSVINYGIFNCVTTKYVKIVDGDDWVDTGNLLILCRYLINCDDDLILTDYDEIYHDKVVNQKALNSEKNADSLNNFNVKLPTIVYRTSIFIDNDIRIREGVYYADIQYDFSPLLYVRKYSYLPVTIYKYRLDNVNQSVSVQSRIKHYSDIKIVESDLCIFYEKALKLNTKPYLIEMIEKSLSNFFINDYIYLFTICSDKIEYKKEIRELRIRDKRYRKIKRIMFKSFLKYRILVFTNFKLLRFYRHFLRGRFS